MAYWSCNVQMLYKGCLDVAKKAYSLQELRSTK